MNNFNFSFEELTDPKKFSEKLNLKNFNKNISLDFYKLMFLIRKVEEKIAEEKKGGKIIGPVHLGAGQEAIAVGISKNLNKKDKVFGAHRSHAHLLGLNQNIRKLFSEILGKVTGFSKGMGGSMHLSDPKSGFMGSVPIVAGTVPLALGAALHIKRNKQKSISLVYLGDGAIEEGIVHESMNLAKILNLPILFVVENNLFSSHMHLSLRQPSGRVSRFAEANEVESKIIDGNDVISMYEITKKLITKIKKGEGPKFVEAITYRQYGHVDFRKDIDVGIKRSKEDLKDWLKRDPIIRLKKSLIESKILDLNKIKNLEKKILREINNSWEKSLKDPYPKEKELLNTVYNNEE